jgi:hypothetical protein
MKIVKVYELELESFIKETTGEDSIKILILSLING